MEQEIREVLQAASTQHDWDTDGTFIQWKDGNPLKGTYRQIAITQALTPEMFKNDNHEADAHLIANAPTYLEWCLSQIAELRKENERLKGGSSKWTTTNGQYT